MIQERGACTHKARNRAMWSDEIYKEGERYRRGQNGKEVYIMQKWGNGTRRQKVKCRSALTAAPRWTKDQRGDFRQIETKDMELNNYECLMGAISWVTMNETTKWLEAEN